MKTRKIVYKRKSSWWESYSSASYLEISFLVQSFIWLFLLHSSYSASHKSLFLLPLLLLVSFHIRYLSNDTNPKDQEKWPVPRGYLVDIGRLGPGEDKLALEIKIVSVHLFHKHFGYLCVPNTVPGTGEQKWAVQDPVFQASGVYLRIGFPDLTNRNLRPLVHSQIKDKLFFSISVITLV